MARPKKIPSNIQNAVDSMFGNLKEPEWNQLSSEKIDLIRGLNYYSSNKGESDSKKWAIDFFSKKDPSFSKKLRGIDESKFGNKGFVCRMISRGFEPDQKTVNLLNDFFNGLKQTEIKRKRAVVKKANPNILLEELEYAVDDCAYSKPVRDFPTLGTTKDVTQCVDYLSSLEKDINENQEGYPLKLARKFGSFIKEAREKFDVTAKAAKRTNSKVSITKPPIEQVKNIRYTRTVGPLKCLHAKTIVGAKKLLAVDLANRKVFVYFSVDQSGLSVSGTTIKNFDPDKSYSKTLRWPDKFIESICGNQFSANIQVVETLNVKKQIPSGRTTETTAFINV